MSTGPVDKLDITKTAVAVPSQLLLAPSQEVALRGMSIMKESYGALPAAFWSLCHSADLFAPRKFTVVDADSLNVYRRRYDARGSYPIVGLKVDWWRSNDPLIIIQGIETVNIGDHTFEGEVILWEGVEELTFHWASKFNKPLELPQGLKKISFGMHFAQPVTLPLSLTEISFNWRNNFNHPINLPASLKKASFGGSFNRPLALPPQLEALTMGNCFNQPITLPSSLTEVSFPGAFNQAVTLPQSIRIAKFGIFFDKPLALPPQLEELYFGDEDSFGGSGVFNQAIDLTACPRLRVVSFGPSFNRPVALPDSIEVINFGWAFNEPVVLPQNLRKLSFGWRFNWPLILPPRLEELTFYEYEHGGEGGDFNHPLTLPENSLRKLRLSDRYDHPINLSEGLEHAYLGTDFNFPVTLPSTLKHLSFAYGSAFNHPIDVPSGLKSASIGAGMEHEVIFPVGLEDLDWWSSAAVALPEGLKHVSFGEGFLHPLTLPSTLESISFDGDSYDLPLVLPPGCSRQY